MPLVRTYEDHVLGKVYADWSFARASDAMRVRVGRHRGDVQPAHPARRGVELLSAIAAFRLPLCHRARRAYGERGVSGSEGAVSLGKRGAVSNWLSIKDDPANWPVLRACMGTRDGDDASEIIASGVDR